MRRPSTITATDMRRINRSAILEIVRRESPISRTLIAEKLGVSLPTVMRIIDELVESSLVRTTDSTEWSGGRRRPLLEFNAEGHAVVGIDLSGSKIFGNVGDGKDFGSALLATVTGLALMVIALFAMPALMRFVTPMVGAVAGGGGGLAAGTVGALASGAISMGSAGRGGGSSTSSTTTSSTSSQSPGSQGPSGTGSQGTAGTSGTAGKTGTRSAGATGAASTGAGSAASGGGEAASGGAVAAGAGGVAVLAAQKGVEAGQAASGAIKDMSEESTGGA